jgi:hypothetical protein
LRNGLSPQNTQKLFCNMLIFNAVSALLLVSLALASR